MKFSLLYEMDTPRPWNDRSEFDVYWEALAQIEGRIPPANIMKSLKLMGQHVLPHFNPHRTIASETGLAAAR